MLALIRQVSFKKAIQKGYSSIRLYSEKDKNESERKESKQNVSLFNEDLLRRINPIVSDLLHLRQRFIFCKEIPRISILGRILNLEHPMIKSYRDQYKTYTGKLPGWGFLRFYWRLALFGGILSLYVKFKVWTQQPSWLTSSSPLPGILSSFWLGVIYFPQNCYRMIFGNGFLDSFRMNLIIRSKNYERLKKEFRLKDKATLKLYSGTCELCDKDYKKSPPYSELDAWRFIIQDGNNSETRLCPQCFNHLRYLTPV